MSCEKRDARNVGTSSCCGEIQPQSKPAVERQDREAIVRREPVNELAEVEQHPHEPGDAAPLEAFLEEKDYEAPRRPV